MIIKLFYFFFLLTNLSFPLFIKPNNLKFNQRKSNLYMNNNHNEYSLHKEYYEYLIKFNKIENKPNLLSSNGNNKDIEHVKQNLRNYKIFEKNYNLIKEFNTNNNHIILGINQFTDQLDFSLNDNLSDINDNMINSSTILLNDINGIKKLLTLPLNLINTYLNLPSKINWIDYLSSTKDQGNCGSCWAFSTTSSIESLMRISNYSAIRLSEQELVDYSDQNSGCNGGLMHLAYDYCIENNGLVSNEQYPYQKKGDGKKNNSEILNLFERVSGSNISSYEFIIPRSKIDIMASLTKGPVAIAIDASPLYFRFYKDGIIDVPTQSSTNINHAVLLVGYNNQENNSYWIIQNSWGNEWGQDGFAKIKMKNGRGVLDCQLYGVYPLYN